MHIKRGAHGGIEKGKFCEMYYYTYHLVDSDGFFSLPDYLKWQNKCNFIRFLRQKQ